MANKSPLEAMFKTHIYPLMRDAGFSRKGGRLFYRLSEVGDAASIEMHSRPQIGVTSFHVEYGIVTAARQAWITHISPTDREALYPSNGIWQRLKMPSDVLTSQFSDGSEWGFYTGYEETMTACGVGLARALREEVIPFLLRMLDKNELSRFIDDLPQTQLDHWHLPMDRARVQTELWLDDWPIDKLQPRLADAFRGDKPYYRLRWAQRRLDERAARENGNHPPETAKG